MFTTAVAVYIVIISFFTQSTIALRCFQCDSANNPKCIDLSDKSIQPQECEVKGDFAERGFTPICSKIGSYKKNIVTRECSSVNSSSDDLCAFVLQWGGDKNPIEYCSICSNRDGCNDANSMKSFAGMVVFGTLLSTIRLLA